MASEPLPDAAPTPPDAASTSVRDVTRSTLTDGLDSLEKSLPEACTAETRDRVGETIARCKRVEVFADQLLHAETDPLRARATSSREFWKPVIERAHGIRQQAEKLVERLLAEERKRREEAEALVRKTASEKMAAQTAAEAAAMAADTPEAAKKASEEADKAWLETREAVQALDKAPARTAVKVGDVTVYEASRLDFDVMDVGAFATAHPELVEVRRGPTLAKLRTALSGALSVPDAVPGFPGIKPKLTTKTSSRR